MTKEKANNKEYVSYYDWLRLLATFLVVIGHSRFRWISSTMGGIDYSLPDTIAPVFNSTFFNIELFLSTWVYSFHMPLFFFLSGAVLGLRPIEKLSTFIIKKAKRLLVPFVLVGFLFMFPILFLKDYYTIDTIKDALLLFFNGLESGYLWFLPSLFWTMIAFAILYKATQKLVKNNCILLLLITFFIQINITTLGDDYKFTSGMIHLFWFTCGWAFEKYLRKKLNLPLCIIMLIFSIIIEIQFYDAWITQIDKKHILYLLYFVGSSLIIAVAYILSRIFDKFTGTKAYDIIMRNLFNIYLFHVPLEYVILKITFSNHLLDTNWGCYLYLFARIFGVIIVSIIIGELIRLILHLFKKYIFH